MNPVEPDEHLRAALRHAPDVDLTAPPQLSAKILAAAARSASADRAGGARRAPAAASSRVRAWLAGWRVHRWGASGALATVLMAGFIGLLWRGDPPGPAPEAPAAAVSPAPAPMAGPGPAPRQEADNRERAPGPDADSSADRSRLADRSLQLSKAQPASPPPEPDARARRTPADEGERRVQAAEEMSAANGRSETTASLSQESVSAAPPPPTPAAARPRGRAAVAALPTPAAPAAPPPWREPPQARDVLSWQPAGDLLAPDAAWLARLSTLTQSRWRPVPGGALGPAPTTGTPQLRWQRDSRTIGYLWLDESGVVWCDAAAACERAPLPEPARHELLAPLTR